MTEFQHSIKVPRLYKDSAKILKSVQREGGSFKNLVFNHNRFSNIKGIHALVAESIKYDSVLSRILNATDLLRKETGLDPWLAKVLLTELLFGKKRLAGDSKPVQTVLKYKDIFLKELPSFENYTTNKSDHIRKAIKPKYVRVNTLKISLEDAIASFKEEGWEELECPNSYDEYLLLIEKRMFNEEYIFVKDFHITNLLVFPNGVHFYDHPAYLEGYIILQDKGSCLATCCLSMKPGSVILDMCAGPGMKTMLFAACINNEGKIYAVEHNPMRYKEMERLLYSHNVTCTESRNCDAGSIGSDVCKDVKYIIVDPSCSGSGMTSRIEDIEKSTRDDFRLQRLANIQGYLLRHAISNFPTAKYVVYSTCSVEEEENEVVVESVLSCASFHGYSLMNIKKKISGWKNFGSDKYECGRKCVYSRPQSDYTNGGFLAIFKRKFKNDLSALRIKMEPRNEDKVLSEKKEIKLSEQFFAVVNTLKISVEEAIQCFVDNDWKYLPAPMDYDVFLTCLQDSTKRKEERFFEQDFHVNELLLFPMGIVDELSKTFVNEQKFILLDKVSCLAVHLLDPLPGSNVLDMCAGNEKLSVFISTRMKNEGCVYAYEQDRVLQNLLGKYLNDCGISCVKAIPKSGLYSNVSDSPGVELILVTPPCSGSGSGDLVKSRYSLIRHSGNVNKGSVLRNYIVTQFSLLRRALTEFPEARRIVYVTRSVHPEENEEIINALLVIGKFHGFKLINAPNRIKGWNNDCKTKYFCATKCLVSRDNNSITKGFFIAVFERDIKSSRNLSAEKCSDMSCIPDNFTELSNENDLDVSKSNDIVEENEDKHGSSKKKKKLKSSKKRDRSHSDEVESSSFINPEDSPFTNNTISKNKKRKHEKKRLLQTDEQTSIEKDPSVSHKKKYKNNDAVINENMDAKNILENGEFVTTHTAKKKSKKSKKKKSVDIETGEESQVDKENVETDVNVEPNRFDDQDVSEKPHHHKKKKKKCK